MLAGGTVVAAVVGSDPALWCNFFWNFVQGKIHGLV